MHSRFFAIKTSAEIIKRENYIFQEYGMSDLSEMLVQNFMYHSDRVKEIWKLKKEVIQSGAVYIGSP